MGINGMESPLRLGKYKMHMNVILMIILIVVFDHRVIGKQFKRSNVPANKKGDLQTGVSLKGIVGSLQIALDYCSDKAILLKRPLASRHCINRWNFNLKKYCLKSSSQKKPKCTRLRKKASKLREHILRSKVRVNTNTRRNNTRVICGERKISPDKYACCAGIRFRPTTHGCCGSEVYRIEKQACCNLQVHDVDGINKIRCCGNELIDVALFFCYNGTLKQIHSVLEKSPGKPSSIRPAVHLTVLIVVTSCSLAVFIAVSVLFCLVRPSLVKFCSRKYLSVHLNRTDYLSMPSTSESLGIENPQKVKETDLTVGSKASGYKGKMSEGDREDECIIDDELKGLTNGLDIDYDGDQLLNHGTVFGLDMSTNDNDTSLIGHQEDSSKKVITSLNGLDVNDTNVLLKETDSNAENMYVSAVDTAVQTSGEKVFNILNSMGKRYDQSFTFNCDNKTLQLPNSAVTLTLSEDDVKIEKRCLASTHRNVSQIRNKLGLHDDEFVASPAVEYHFIHGNITNLATVKMPFIGDPSKLVVLKVKSDHSTTSDVEKTEIKRKDSLKGVATEECYEIIGPGLLAIYVRSMSWLVCKYCGDKHPNFHLDAMLYGRLDADPELPCAHEISMSLYLIDELYLIPDYRQNLEEYESGRKRLLWRRILLPGEVTMSDKIQVSLTLDHQRGEWQHRRNINNTVISAEKVDISVDNITGCHAQQNPTGLPFAKEWQLKSTRLIDGHVPRLRCIATTAHISGSTGALSCEDPHYIDTRPIHDDFEKRNHGKKDASSNSPSVVYNDPNISQGNFHCQPSSAIVQPENEMVSNACADDPRPLQHLRKESQRVTGGRIQQPQNETEHVDTTPAEQTFPTRNEQSAIFNSERPINGPEQLLTRREDLVATRRTEDQVAIMRTEQSHNDPGRVNERQYRQGQGGPLRIENHRESAEYGLNDRQSEDSGGQAIRERPHSEGSQNDRVRGELHRQSLP